MAEHYRTKSYVVWNNKGGVGKTTLCFHIATRYAHMHREVNVLAVDMCPQANLSMSLLTNRDPESAADKLREISTEGNTVADYLTKSLEPGVIAKPEKYLIRPNRINRNVAENLFLICGDPALEYVGKHLEQRRSEHALATYDPWKNSTLLLKQLIQKITAEEGDWFVIIDTNPSFNVYTELAIVAADRLLVPINADEFSTKGIINMFEFIYGRRILPDGEESPFENFKHYAFSEIARKKEINLPKVHLLISNRTTVYRTRTAKAWRAVSDKATNHLHRFFLRYPGLFTDNGVAREGMTDDEFAELYQVNLQDFHTTAVLCIYSGTPLHEMQSSTIEVYNETVKGSQFIKRSAQYGANLDNLLQKL